MRLWYAIMAMVVIGGTTTMMVLLHGVDNSNRRIEAASDNILNIETDGSQSTVMDDVAVDLFVPTAIKSTTNGCIVKSSKKVHRQLRNSTSSDKVVNEIVYFADDGCALGHLVKDAAIITSYMAMGAPISKVVFSHPCADPQGGTPLLKNIILEWYKAIRNITFEFVIELPKRKCYKLIYTRPGWRWFYDQKHADKFRKLLWSHFRILPPPSPTHDERNQITITLIKRTSNRRFSEDQSAGKISEYCSKSFCRVQVVILEKISYGDQLQQLFQTDVLFAAHGAGLSSITVMKAGTALVELFPYNFKYLMFEELARLLSLFYFPYESPHRSSCCPRVRTADNVSSFPQLMRQVNGAKACKNCDIVIPETDLMLLLRNSMQSVLLARHRLTNVLHVDRRS
eukprot:TRINITY_DN2220_c0_g1_i2.p1 TRINITY_DN2220_c0_g1~~TRINITY_DN2220_c0_g1_i2.p1  ORF type:complete len:398 (+),score=46.21 TRINITY_DN2220_c0_g1_i2:93-1286(+)